MRVGKKSGRRSVNFAISGKLAFGTALAVAGVGMAGAASAESTSDAQIRALQAQIEQLQRQNQNQINDLQRKVRELSGAQAKADADAKAARDQAARAQADAKAAADKAAAANANIASAYGAATGKAPFGGMFDANGHGFFERKPGNGPLTFYVPGGEFSVYGNLDVSVDDTSKNVNHSMAIPDSGPPLGNFGWMPAISTNSSYFGARGFQKVGDYAFNFVWQVEAGFDISSTPGLKVSNSNISDTVNGALFNRNTYIGVSSPIWGAIKVGKTSAPYANSTAAFNPFAGQIGNYNVIMGNTGGDNRVEFGTRLDHSIWYESPTIGGFQFNALFSPGQNRDNNSGDVAMGESDCTGGNAPTSGGNFPIACNDGAFSNALSTNLSYTHGGFYATAAYERHFAVNRQSDVTTAMYGITAPVDPAATGPTGAFSFATSPAAAFLNLTPTQAAYAQMLYNGDVADEDAFKVGALYRFETRTTVGAIFESMHRYVPAALDFFNERTRNGTWVFVSQQLTETDSIHFGWAHAFAAKGDPGQHNDQTSVSTVPLTGEAGAPFAPNNNQADMITSSYKRKLSDSLTWYSAVAATFNGPSAHYDLGAGGHGLVTDCHDTFGADGSYTSAPHCWTGTTIVGFSTGLQYRF